jgi:hypothetical protein
LADNEGNWYGVMVQIWSSMDSGIKQLLQPPSQDMTLAMYMQVVNKSKSTLVASATCEHPGDKQGPHRLQSPASYSRRRSRTRARFLTPRQRRSRQRSRSPSASSTSQSSGSMSGEASRTCWDCHGIFPSRSKLFRHIRACPDRSRKKRHKSRSGLVLR